jgi:hypothetical protein
VSVRKPTRTSSSHMSATASVSYFGGIAISFHCGKRNAPGGVHIPV